MEDLTIRKATLNDVVPLVDLINSAYRGDASRNGWTHEADLIEGSTRITEKALINLISTPGTIILVATKNGQINGCVLLEKQDKDLYLGMLSVSPFLQAKGTGKFLLQQAEMYAMQESMEAIVMSVISIRYELINWYKKKGYSDTGDKKPFPENEGFGTPKQKLEFAVLKKNLL